MNKTEFENIYKQFSVSGNNKKMILYIFKAYDLNKDGWLDFNETIIALNVLYEQDLVKMLKLAFKIYDLNGDGKIIGE